MDANPLPYMEFAVLAAGGSLVPRFAEEYDPGIM